MAAGVRCAPRDAPPVDDVGGWVIPARCSELDLSYRAIGPAGGRHLAAALDGSSAELSLNLTWTALGLEGVAALARPTRLSRLSALDLSGNWLTDAGVQLLADGLRRTPSLRLRQLHLRWNRLSPAGAEALGLALPSARSLEVLDLGGNYLGSAGAARIATACSALPRLRQLRLDSNAIDGAGAAASLTSLLRDARRLRGIELGGNRINGDGFRQLVPGIASAPVLESVGLAYNSKYLVSSANALAAVVRDHPTLRRVDLRGAYVESAGAESLVSAFEASESMAVLDLEALPRGKDGRRGPVPVEGAELMVRLQRLAAQRLVAAGAAANGSGSTPGPTASEYWRLVYPASRSTHGYGSLQENAARGRARLAPSTFFYASVAPGLLGAGCAAHSWARCRLDEFLVAGSEPPRIRHGSLFAPFRIPPGACMRSLFRWGDELSGWKAAYPYSDGAPDGSYVEVAHTREVTGGAWMYLAPGSGVFWDCGRSLRARNKVDAAVTLLQRGLRLSRALAVERLAEGIAADEQGMCDGDHCRVFMSIMRSNRTDRNDNCFGACSPARPLSHWLPFVASGEASREWRIDHMAASSVFDAVLVHWARRLGFDSIQLTMQPQVWCGLGWTTELLDLRAAARPTARGPVHLFTSPAVSRYGRTTCPTSCPTSRCATRSTRPSAGRAWCAPTTSRARRSTW